ncbi:unnamed protein product [Gulo gulo]|uniref:Uncharacterized protein n=1 Tax=Gulo gulo TaxID=48420 RepID=A0A9X9LXU3_GULGU|nr:unnamed protein product [Gulo gulo]
MRDPPVVSQGAGHGTGSTCCFPNPSPCREKHWFLRLEWSPRAAASLAGGRLGAPTQHSPCTKIPPENHRCLLERLRWIRAQTGAEREISHRPHASPAVKII